MIAALMLLAFQAVAAPTPPDDNPCDYIIRNVWDPKFTPVSGGPITPALPTSTWASLSLRSTMFRVSVSLSTS